MKLNHLILVICTGILVGFSACKKDPFTEEDAIAAQKELITMKYGYELQLKNIEAAIQKAHDEAAIAITKLEIQGASDLSKQNAAQEIARNLAALEAERQDWLRMKILKDSMDRVFAARNAAETAAAAFKNAATVYNGVITVKDQNSKFVAGAVVKVMNFDGSAFFTGTSDANGQINVKDFRTWPSMIARVTVPASATAIYAGATVVMSSLMNNYDQKDLFVYSYNPASTVTIKGTVYAALDLTNASSNEGAGAGVGIKISTKLKAYGPNPLASDTSVVLNIPGTVTGSNGSYTLVVPKHTSALDSFKVSLASEGLNFAQRAYTLGAGSNEYQRIPTVEDSGRVVLANGSDGYDGDGGWPAGVAYFLSLPDAIQNKDSKKKYTMTLTDPLFILFQGLGGGNLGERTSDGAFNLSTTSMEEGFRFDADGFVLNNGWMRTAASEDTSYYYSLPQVALLKDSTWKDTGNLNPDSSTYDPLGLGYSSKYFTLNEWLALSLAQRTVIMAVRTANGVATFTPTTKDTKVYGPDTLAVTVEDLTGFFVEEAPELYAIAYAEGAKGQFDGDGTSSKGKLQIVELLDADNGGLFNIDAIIEDEENAIYLFTNSAFTPSNVQTSWTLAPTANTTKKNFYYGTWDSGFEVSVPSEGAYDPKYVDGDTLSSIDYEMYE